MFSDHSKISVFIPFVQNGELKKSNLTLKLNDFLDVFSDDKFEKDLNDYINSDILSFKGNGFKKMKSGIKKIKKEKNKETGTKEDVEILNLMKKQKFYGMILKVILKSCGYNSFQTGVNNGFQYRITYPKVYEILEVATQSTFSPTIIRIYKDLEKFIPSFEGSNFLYLLISPNKTNDMKYDLSVSRRTVKEVVTKTTVKSRKSNKKQSKIKDKTKMVYGKWNVLNYESEFKSIEKLLNINDDVCEQFYNVIVRRTTAKLEEDLI